MRRIPGGTLTHGETGQSGWLQDALAELTHAPTGYSGLNAQTVTLLPGAQSRNHHGDNPALLSVLEGCLHLAWDDATLLAPAGDTLAVSPNTRYTVTGDGESQSRYILFLPIAPGC